jgi:hypothetical protein
MLYSFLNHKSFSDFLAIYQGAVGAFPATSWTAFDIWELIFGDESLHVLDSTKFAGISYRAIGLSLYLATALCAVVSLWKSEQTLENLMLFAGWIYLAFFLFPTEMHGRFFTMASSCWRSRQRGTRCCSVLTQPFR